MAEGGTGKGRLDRRAGPPGLPGVQGRAGNPAAAWPEGETPSPGPRPRALRGARGRNNSARGRGGGGGGALRRAPPPARPPRSHTRSHTGSHPPPAQALPAGAAAAAAAPAMDVRLYPSAPAVGARPGAEPAGLAPLDYYHCGKVGGGRGWAPSGRGLPAPSDPAPRPARPGLERGAGGTWRPGTGLCRRPAGGGAGGASGQGTRTQPPRRRAHAAHTDTFAVTLRPRVIPFTGRSHLDSHSHDDTVTLTLSHVPLTATRSFPGRHTVTHCHTHRQPCTYLYTVFPSHTSHSNSRLYTMTCSHSPTHTVTSTHASHPSTQHDAAHSVTCPQSPVTPSHNWGQAHKEVAPTVTRSHSQGLTRARTVTHSHPCTVNPRHTNRLAATQRHAVTLDLRAAPALTPVPNSRVGALTCPRPGTLIGRSLIGRHSPGGALGFRVGSGQSRPVASRGRR